MKIQTPSKANKFGPYLKIVEAYYNRPVDFAQDFYCDLHPTNKKLDANQTDLINSIFNHKATSARSGTGTGKTSALTLAAACYLLTRPLSLVVVTGPKFDQIKDTFWNEFQRWQLYSPLGQLFHVGSDKIYPVFAKEMFGKSADMWCIMARTCKEPQGLAGLHAEDSLFICDEASAIDDLIYEVIEGNLTKKRNKIVLTGQPNATRGYYFDSHHKDIDMWNTLHFDSEKSILADPAYNLRIKKKYGENSDVYTVRVKGDFPSGNPKAMMQYADIMAAVNREVVASGAFEVGVDVARYGDDMTVIAVRQGNKLYPLEAFAKLDNVQVAARVLEIIERYRELTSCSGIIKVKVDDTGVGGGVTDILKHNKKAKISVIPINFGGSPKDGKHYDNASKMWKEFADQLKYLELPNDDDLTEELSTRRKDRHASGLIKIESKDTYKSDYHQSPDRADATMLAFTTGTVAKRVWTAFYSWNEKQCRNFVINWKQFMRKNAQIYMTMYQEPDMTTSLLATLWDGQDGKLYVFKEVVSATPRPEHIIPRFKEFIQEAFREHDIPMQMNQFLWYANQEMFGLTEKSSSMKGMRDGTATAFESPEYGLFLQPNLMFDKPGAISIAGSMIAANMIIVHSSCEDTIVQMQEWSVQNGKPTTENIGCCMALCNIISLLHQWGKTNKFMVKLPEYSIAREKSLAEINRADEEGKLTQLEAKKAGIMVPTKVRPGIHYINV